MYACLAEAGHPDIEIGVTLDGDLGARVGDRLDLTEEEMAALVRAADVVGLEYEGVYPVDHVVVATTRIVQAVR